MRVLHTESSTGWGGQENRTLNELITMRQRGHELAVLSRPGARILERAKEAGFETFAVDMRGAIDFPAIFRLRGVIQRFRADIVNTHSSRDTQLAGMAARSIVGRRPRIVRTRHLALPITSKFTYSVLPDHVVTVSKFVENYLVEAGVPRAKITTVSTGVDFARYDRSTVAGDLRAELGLPADALLIGTVAILRAKKGHAEILDAVPTVLQRFPDAHFVFAGDGAQTANLTARIAADGLGGRVHLLGLRRDVTNILASLDVFVLPTHQEALGTAFIEAGAMGLPAVASAVDGVPEVIQDGRTGLLVPVKDGAAIAEALCKLLADPVYRRGMGANAAEFVRRKFSREAMAEGMERLYLQLLEAR
ncbi:glycosyltransferase family 4 protein [Dechloromonas denitrificans]|uniref:glycosyltransferase family 4 protein n=1 Tax=Dechloromonas denitrificans TaxID=281362 RepID=UPI001CF87178|nr:glycosyltransferase family 4 protein [Dechloromonas denitrificans]UCV03832.1 glycosyltransferase family 4 protein [Dechloromonas denitrificans]UCV08095.1 glycosyltransferase family 4 protein [Dechloromonas denitrificans]